MSVPLTQAMKRRQRSEPCLLIDANIPNYVVYGLRRRGFRVVAVGRDVTHRLPDRYIAELAQRNGCVIVTKDHDFDGERNAVYVPQEWFEKYNSWEIVTKIVKLVFSSKSMPDDSPDTIVELKN